MPNDKKNVRIGRCAVGGLGIITRLPHQSESSEETSHARKPDDTAPTGK